jgi:hypothetical protein
VRLGIVILLALRGVSAAAPAAEVELKSADNRVTVTRGNVQLVFDAAGRGFVTSAKLGDNEVCAATEGSGLFASITPPVETIIRPSEIPGRREPVAESEIPAAVSVDSVTGKKVGEKAEVTIVGTASFGKVGKSPFRVTVVIPPSGPTMAVSAEMKLPTVGFGTSLLSYGLALPLKLNFHPTSKGEPRIDRKTAAAAILPRAGTPIPEVRWLVAQQDDTSVWGQMLWTLAGVRQLTPAAAEVWEAWSPQNPMFVLQYHNVHPGWMAVADGRAAIAAAMPGIEKVAPKEIYVDSQAKVLRICFQSPYCRPVRLTSMKESLTAGPAYVLIEPVQANTRNPEDYRDPKKRPALAAIGDVLAESPPTQCNFSGMKLVGPVPAKSADAAPMPADPEFISHEPGDPSTISLWVDNPQGAGLDALPITRGIPLARGALSDAKKVALVDAEGKPVPCVAKAVAFWPDRSIKWLLLDFQARLQAFVGAKYKVIVGERARPAPIPRPLQVAETPQEVSVDTGKLKMALAKREGKLAATVGLDMDGDGKVAQSETIIRSDASLFRCVFSHIKNSEQYRSHTWIDPGELDPGEAEITEVRVEEQSPLRAVILLRANLKHKLLASTIPPKNRPETGSPVTLRLHLYAGSSMVRVQHTFMFAGDVNHDFLRELGIGLPFPADERQTVRTSLDGALVERSRLAGIGLLQENPDAAFVWQTGHNWRSVEARGRTADGWLDVSGEKWGVTVGLAHMREMFPQEIHVDSGGIWTDFYSPHAVPMDLRRYAFKYGDGESSSTGWGSAFGAMRTHEACWYFHPAKEPVKEAAVRAKAMLDPPLARVRPRHVADTLAAGHVAEHGAATNDPHFDAVLLHMPRMHQHNREFWRWFGFWDFGDEIQVYSDSRQRWDRDDGRYGWYNNEPLRDYNYHLAFLMTGNRRIWEQAAAISRHVLEVDVRHALPQPLMSARPKLRDQQYDHSTTQGIDICGRRHNCQHWADGYFGQRVGSPAGFRLCYYQTGDPVLREHLERLLAAALATPRSQYMGADGDEAVLWAMIMGHEMTLDEKYLDRIKGYMKLQVEFAGKHNGFPAAQANWDWATNTAGAAPADPRDDIWIWSFGGHVAMIEIADLLGDPAVDQMLRNWLLALEGFGPDKKRREAWSNNIGASSLLAYYYRRTGDSRAIEWFQRRAKSFHSKVPEAAPKVDLPMAAMADTLPAYTPNDGYGWVYPTSSFWYIGIPSWQGALRERAGK